MTNSVLSIETTVTTIQSDLTRTVLTLQNLDTVATDYVYVGDEPDPDVSGIRLSGQGGSITLRRSNGEEPEKKWYIVATTASTPVRKMELFGEVSTPTPSPAPTPTPERVPYI